MVGSAGSDRIELQQYSGQDLADLVVEIAGDADSFGFLSSTLTIFFEAGEFAAIPSLVGMEDLVTANGRIQASYSAAAIAALGLCCTGPYGRSQLTSARAMPRRTALQTISISSIVTCNGSS